MSNIILDICEYQEGITFLEKPLLEENKFITRITKKSGAVDLMSTRYKDHKNHIGYYKYVNAMSTYTAQYEVEQIKKCGLLDGTKILWVDLETVFLRENPEICEKVFVVFLDNFVNVGIYCDLDFYRSNVSKWISKYNVPLWVACYGRNNGEVDERKIESVTDIKNVAMWQFTSKYKGYNLDASITIDKMEYVPYNTEKVKEVQRFLNDRYKYNLSVDGVMGKKTFTALCRCAGFIE